MPVILDLTKPTAAQIAQIAVLYDQVDWWHPTPDDAGTLSRMVAGSHHFVVAMQDHRIVGMGRAISDGASDAYIQDVAVLPDHRGRGIGRRIVHYLIDRLRADGVDWIGLVAEGDSRDFYQTIGFDPMPDMIPMRLVKHEPDTP